MSSIFSAFSRALVTGQSFDWEHERCWMALMSSSMVPRPDDTLDILRNGILRKEELTNQVVSPEGVCMSDSVLFADVTLNPGESANWALLYCDRFPIAALQRGIDVVTEQPSDLVGLVDTDVVIRPNGQHHGGWFRL